MASRLRHLNVKQYVAPQSEDTDDDILQRRKAIGKWDKRRLIELLAEERGYLEKSFRKFGKPALVELFVESRRALTSKVTCAFLRSATVSVI